ncbi:hypothetical protein ZOSMA_32G00770 [Zostera marina]|uniref:Bifunctional inhibitor/plant lipid transfer protein/seed storage helical domain-containing protein n=1 Tax=Zostera marina TaxID=29655 RepID=A0A0K9PAL8_ZOSMR|nr:hypothetical protein ZOSMA_32G00770 [Zostera marina]
MAAKNKIKNKNVLMICMVLWVTIASWIVCIASAQPQPTCLPKLLPCQPFLHNTSPPPESCCIPLLDLMDNDPDCFCAIFSNKDFLETFNVTKKEAFNLPNLCGHAADGSSCKADGTSQPPGNVYNFIGRCIISKNISSFNSNYISGSLEEPSHSTPTSVSAASGGGYLQVQALLFGWIASIATAALL